MILPFHLFEAYEIPSPFYFDKQYRQCEKENGKNKQYRSFREFQTRVKQAFKKYGFDYDYKFDGSAYAMVEGIPMYFRSISGSYQELLFMTSNSEFPRRILQYLTRDFDIDMLRFKSVEEFIEFYNDANLNLRNSKKLKGPLDIGVFD